MRAHKPILLGPFPPSQHAHRRHRRRFGVLAVLTFILLALLGWYIYQPRIARQADDIPPRVHALLQAHHAPYTSIASISPAMQHALVAIEDRRFYQHHGIDVHGMARALFQDITSGRFDQGGATITIQLVEDTIPIDGNILVRGAKTLALAWVVEDVFSKQRILELYLNAVYYGRGAYGIGSAAQTYFHQSPRALDVADAAFLASLPQAPSIYGSHPFAASTQARWQTVIRAMASQGYITRVQEQTALHTRLHLVPG